MTQDVRQVRGGIRAITARAAATEPDHTADEVLAMPSADLLVWLRREAILNGALEVVELAPRPAPQPARGLAPPPPDVIISRESGTARQRGFVVEVAESSRFAVRLLPAWAELCPASGDPHPALTESQRLVVQECLARARTLVALVRQRRQTLARLAWCLLDLHWDALQRGDDTLTPLARAPVAFRAGMQEATLAHAIAGKWLQLPAGNVVTLVSCFQTEQSVTTAILELVAHEARPLTDADLVRALWRRAIHLDERTVAAYRRQLGVPPARLRAPAAAEAPAPPARAAREPVAPSSRARQLLRSVLSRQEREQLSRTGYLEVPSPGHPNRLYRIPNYLGRVRMFERGQAVCDLCVVPSEELPADDVIVMHKLMIQGDEEAYLRSANRFPLFAAPLPVAEAQPLIPPDLQMFLIPD
jgi:hypothetical protein